jgi:hypothetical protein
MIGYHVQAPESIFKDLTPMTNHCEVTLDGQDIGVFNPYAANWTEAEVLWEKGV